ncbi:hypothetical protein baBA2_000094 [Borrelia anserina]|uniref:Uncharacterized protein n=2 Tax=Borrelia anserina TaxID=143 RepID=W5SP39_BORAN|nr:hypothetical protein [Borrelia anserina]AHH08059.1 Hypothetical protein BAN_0105500 [Borrelia anserina BA2]AHH08934.1 Hypothetical protein BAN_0105501 [Borrelia anserina BA2]APR64606.1 hypothetical protein N187_00465 [Borrelia anserina Es]UPA06519.1 hypothetical protein baBA2_000094 [Borrelia anserina]
MGISRFEEFENELFNICLYVDCVLEDEFGNSYEVHPNRLSRGKAANGLLDGLFRVTTSFTLGYGSKFGRGYLIIIEIITLDVVDIKFNNRVIERGIEVFSEKLREKFPERNLSIVHDINVYKIIGGFFGDI